MDPRKSSEAARLEALRRRLYAPGVTQDDVAAYRSAETGAVSLEPTARPARVVASRTRATIVAGGGVLGVVLVVAAVAALLVTHPLAAVTAPRATSTSTPSTPAGITQARVPASSSTRLMFVDLLREGGAPGLLQYLYGNPTFLPANLRTNSRADSTEYSGRGTSTIALDPSVSAQQGGRVTVILVTDRAAAFSWSAERIAQRNDRSGPVVTLASHPGNTRPGEPVTSTFVYDSGAPGRLALNLDDSVHWGAVVVFTD
ncbi:hypothetical protein [uncultured Amnibacterium sp.]|uniref:hypothetical protein n=1 Tax=uncultured Amnibacterium sp. TaxID=1631851 RepID=UPI0035CB72DA